jgi:cbb3-type cytochrome oxidase subunit 3
MRAKSINNILKILFPLFITIFSYVEEGSIYIPMVSNFTLQHKKLNNKNYYTIPLRIGTPSEEYNVQVDTSTSTTWVPSSKCVNCDSSHRFYIEEDSKTSSPTNSLIKLEDEDGNVEGYEISDNIKLGQYKLKQFGFVQVTKVADDFKDHYGGKLGLGYKSHIDNDDFNFLEKLQKSNLITKKIFSINAINDKRGMLLIGDLPGKQYNTFCNVTNEIEDVDDMYKESWICHLTHVGVFDTNKGIFNKLKYYDELTSNNLVNFDSAYDFIAVPIAEKDKIEKLLEKANLECTTSKKNENEETENESLRNRIREEEITISCKTNSDELSEKNLALSFVLQGYVYSIPLDLLFVKGQNDGEMEMLIKYIDDDEAIWTFGYPFMNQFLMVFNMEENHVGIKKLRKTALPIINVYKDWIKWNVKHDYSFSVFQIIGIIILILVVLAILFLIYRAIRKKFANSNSGVFVPENNANNNNINNNNNDIVY